jgi:hypothetical protein
MRSFQSRPPSDRSSGGVCGQEGNGMVGPGVVTHANLVNGLRVKQLQKAPLRDAPDFVEVGEAGIAVDDAMRRQRRVQLVG